MVEIRTGGGYLTAATLEDGDGRQLMTEITTGCLVIVRSSVIWIYQLVGAPASVTTWNYWDATRASPFMIKQESGIGSDEQPSWKNDVDWVWMNQ